MSKNAKKSIEEYSKKTQREAERRIKIKEDRKGRKLSEQEKRDIAKRVAKSRRKNKIFAGALVSFGMSLGILGTNKYNQIKNQGIDKQKNTITIDSSIAGIDEINVKSKKYKGIIFKNEIKVTVDGEKLDRVDDVQEKNIREATRKEINNLETKEQVLEYIKKIYSEEYNKNNDDKIGENDIKLYRDRYMVRLDEDTAKNGDKILRIAEGHTIDQNRYNLPNGIITVQVNTDKGIITENIAKKDGRYFRIYDGTENVKKYKDNIAAKIGKILDYGISVAYSKEDRVMISKDDEENYKKLVEGYENKLIEEICKRKNNQIYELEGINNEDKEIENGR